MHRFSSLHAVDTKVMPDRGHWRIALGEQDQEQQVVRERYGPATEEEAINYAMSEFSGSTRKNVQLTPLPD